MTWNAYHLLSNRARSVCQLARQQQQAAHTQLVVDNMIQATAGQLADMNRIRVSMGGCCTGCLCRWLVIINHIYLSRLN